MPRRTADSAELTHDDILEPDGWMLLNALMDARTGLGRFREFRISNYMLWQLAYSELIFTNVLWPDFRREHLYDAVREDVLKEGMRVAVAGFGGGFAWGAAVIRWGKVSV